MPYLQVDGQKVAISDHGERMTVICERCGSFRITATAAATIARRNMVPGLAALIRQHAESGQEFPEINSYSLRDFETQLPNLAVNEKQMALLRALKRKSSHPGAAVNVVPELDFPLAWATSEEEFVFQLRALQEKGFIVRTDGPADLRDSFVYMFEISARGLDRLEQDVSAAGAGAAVGEPFQKPGVERMVSNSKNSAAKYDRLFMQPGLDMLKPGMAGTAVSNLKIALSRLVLQREWTNSDRFDAELQAAVLSLQKAAGHANQDGLVGPGTRELLISSLLAKNVNLGIFTVPHEYDVALSFAGEQRHYAESLAAILKTNGIRVFYDAYEQADIWGKNLVDHLEDIYGNRAQFCVIFCSRQYAEKAWPNQERVALQERAMRDRSSEYILPIRIDDTKIPGIPSTVAYISISIGIGEIARLLLTKLRAARGAGVPVAPH